MRYIRRNVRVAMVAFLTLLLIATSSTNSAPSSLQGKTTISNFATISGPNYATISGRFEIELMGPDDIPSLDDELDIDVLGTVQQTPRYGVSGEAWVDGVWISSLFFDTTLSDRFVVECTEEKAIKMSSYVWVEWTAPVLEGDQELPPNTRTRDNFVDTILFETGAEAGTLGSTPVPPWDYKRADGDSYIKVVSSPVHSGTKAIEHYQPAPPKTDGERRATLRIYQTSLSASDRTKEFYFSWWVYFPNEPPWTTTDPDGWGTTIGGIKLWFGPPDNRHKWHFKFPNFHVAKKTREICAHFSWHEAFGTSRKDWVWGSGLHVDDYLGEWIQLQAYAKVTTGSDSTIRAWVYHPDFNGGVPKLFMDKTTWTDTHDGITVKALDPRAYDEWSENDCAFWDPNAGGYPQVGVALYDDVGSAEKRIFVDDVVWATEQVPQSYVVVDR